MCNTRVKNKQMILQNTAFMFLLEYKLRICFRMSISNMFNKMKQIESQAAEPFCGIRIWETKEGRYISNRWKAKIIKSSLPALFFPSAGVISATPANTPSKVRFSFPVGSIFKGITLIIAFCSADLSDSTAAASTSPVRPKPACR